jgi:hypothetical protein
MRTAGAGTTAAPLLGVAGKVLMDRRIDAHIARTRFGQIMDLAAKNNERFIVVTLLGQRGYRAPRLEEWISRDRRLRGCPPAKK